MRKIGPNPEAQMKRGELTIKVHRASGDHRQGEIAALFARAVERVRGKLDAERRTEQVKETSQNLRLA